MLKPAWLLHTLSSPAGQLCITRFVFSVPVLSVCPPDSYRGFRCGREFIFFSPVWLKIISVTHNSQITSEALNYINVCAWKRAQPKYMMPFVCFIIKVACDEFRAGLFRTKGDDNPRRDFSFVFGFSSESQKFKENNASALLLRWQQQSVFFKAGWGFQVGTGHTAAAECGTAEMVIT